MDVSVRAFFPEPPAFAELAPERAVYVGQASGRCEVFAWDVPRGARRQLTDRPQGTVACAIDPSGDKVWWFDDDLSGVGIWQVQPFGGGSARPLGLPRGRVAGLAMALDGTAAVGIATDEGLSVHLVRPEGDNRIVASVEGHGNLVDLSGSGALIAIAGEPDAADAVVIVDCATGARTVLPGTEHALWAAGFATDAGAERLLLTRRSGDGYRLAIWSAEDGLTTLDPWVFETEISPSWYPDGRRILVRQDRHARSTLRTIDLRTNEITVMDTPPGSILSAAAQPDGDLHYIWTDSTHPPMLRTASGRRVPETWPDDIQPGRLAEVWVPGPGGPVHTLLTLPDSEGPHATVFLLHGGPFEAARDAYDPLVSVFTSVGCAVVRPNFRGSTGYGADWRDRFDDGVGLTQLRDVAAVREHLVEAGVTRPDRVAVCGSSWGGYLALLAAGVQPDLWHAVAAVNPIADYPTAFRDTTPAIRALDIALFGGDPDQLPEAYARSSPLTYASAVRTPVLVVAGTDDAKCPPAQIHRYIAELRRHDLTPELEWTRSGHEAYQTDVLVQMLSSVVGFICTALGGRPEPFSAPSG